MFRLQTVHVHCILQITFYGMHAEAAMGAHVFEEAYNLLLHKGVQEFGGQGKGSIMDYRCGRRITP